MSGRSLNPYIITSSHQAARLKRLPRTHEHFNEEFLQEILAAHPEILPAAHLREDVGPLLCIGREIPVSCGNIDNLYLSSSGYPLIVECKLWRNPQARREVLSQTLDYIKELVQQDYEWFEKQWNERGRKNDEQGRDLVHTLSDLSQDELDQSFLVDRVNRALSRGDVLAMIVGDGIETRLQELVDHLCRDSAHLRYSLALVEFVCYPLERGANEEMLVVPRIVESVDPVQRAYGDR